MKKQTDSSRSQLGCVAPVESLFCWIQLFLVRIGVTDASWWSPTSLTTPDIFSISDHCSAWTCQWFSVLLNPLFCSSHSKNLCYNLNSRSDACWTFVGRCNHICIPLILWLAAVGLALVVKHQRNQYDLASIVSVIWVWRVHVCALLCLKGINTSLVRFSLSIHLGNI